MVEAPIRPAVGTGGRMTIRCQLACKTSPEGICRCPVAEAAPNGVLILRQEHTAVDRGPGRHVGQKHETRLFYRDLMRLLLSVASDAVPVLCGVEGCGREVARVIPGGMLELKRTHYGESHARRMALFELTRLLLVADEGGS